MTVNVPQRPTGRHRRRRWPWRCRTMWTTPRWCPLDPPTLRVSHWGAEPPAWHQVSLLILLLVLICAFADVAGEPCWYCLRSLDAQYRAEAPRQVSTTLPKHIIPRSAGTSFRLWMEPTLGLLVVLQSRWQQLKPTQTIKTRPGLDFNYERSTTTKQESFFKSSWKNFRFIKCKNEWAGNMV